SPTHEPAFCSGLERRPPWRWTVHGAATEGGVPTSVLWFKGSIRNRTVVDSLPLSFDPEALDGRERPGEGCRSSNHGQIRASPKRHVNRESGLTIRTASVLFRPL